MLAFRANLGTRYADWQKKTKTSIPRAGEQELSNAKSFANAINPNGRHYRHNSMTAPTPNSKSSVRKSLKRYILLFP